MKIVLLDISSVSVDTINVDEKFIEKYYNDDVLSFLCNWCGYSEANIQFMTGDSLNYFCDMNLQSFCGDEELDISPEELEHFIKSGGGGMNIKAVEKEYLNSEVCIGETLEHISANGLSLKQAFELYIEAMNKFEGDEFYQIADGEKINLTE